MLAQDWRTAGAPSFERAAVAALDVIDVRPCIAKAVDDIKVQVNPDSPDAAAFQQRYPKAQLRKFDAETADVTEADALVAYLQMLGTLVDFKLYNDKANLR